MLRIYVPLIVGGGIAVAALSLLRLFQAGLVASLLGGLGIWAASTLGLVSGLTLASWVLYRRWHSRELPVVLSFARPASTVAPELRRAA